MYIILCYLHYGDYVDYSGVPNSGIGWNSGTGWNNCKYQIKVQGGKTAKNLIKVPGTE